MSLKIGDEVRYSTAFLKSIAAYTGNLPFARGVIVQFKPLGEQTLAIVDWGDPDVPEKVNVKNLEKRP